MAKYKDITPKNNKVYRPAPPPPPPISDTKKAKTIRENNGKLSSNNQGNCWGEAVDRLAEYENAEAEGRLVMLPCKIGDTVWLIRNYRGVNHPQLGEVSEMFFDVDMALQIVVKHVGRGKFGEKVFRTLEEAEQALKGGCK